MSIAPALLERANSVCELCAAADTLEAYDVGPEDNAPPENTILICASCKTQSEGQASLDSEHWKALSDSMWSQVPAVQVLAWRMLNQLSGESWASELLDMMYLEDEVKLWAEAGLAAQSANSDTPTRDSNGTELKDGDTVTIIKDLVVKGAGFTAKRGTAVRNISLTDNPEHIEGRVNGTRIVLVSAFLKKSV
ncbi:MAG: PhnA domain protein [Robiginitomaculum sp.]|nr:MAG: PhnA domain protein [Robiginitomaculum sp.]